MPRNLASQKQAAERYGVTVRTIRNYIAAGKITGYQLPGGPIRVDLDELDRVLVTMPTGWPASNSSGLRKMVGGRAPASAASAEVTR